ncbi:cystathionine beta-lyase [Pseudomonas oryzihabitans]|nr:cystathionine beta-lyase [Pseudomonas psychrotolerans]KTT66526.1 cystathionine beta-lyase [Pseudomonas psychrotolerans]
MKINDFAGNPYASLAPPVWRGSTVVFDSFEDFVNRKTRHPDGYSYGSTGTPTARQLELKIARLEGARHCLVLPSGASALITTVLSFVRGGDHLLIAESCYGALQDFAQLWLQRMGVDVEFYPPTLDAGIEALIRPNTRLICLEAPGTITMEMQDIDAITRIARRHNVLTLMDNTWASPLFFQALDHGVDFVVQAVTKYLGGHSDLLMGSVSLNDGQHYATLRETQSVFGQATSPDDCFLVERGLQTYPLRLREQSRKALNIARWLETQPLVEKVLFPALESDPGHRIWREQFQGCGCLLSVILQPAEQEAAYGAFFDTLELFPIGASWGGTSSLIAYYPAELQRARRHSPTDQPVVRISVGLEDENLLLQDLERALRAYAVAR